MKRFFLSAAMGLATVAGGSCDAFWLDAFYCHLESGREENNQWPSQFVGADRVNASAPFEVMIRNGWRRQNLLGSHHFTEDGTKLTQSGRLRVQWILTQAPEQHRQLFIERSLQDELTQARIAAANQFAAEVVRNGYAQPAQETHILSDGRPAVTVDFVNTQFRENMPIPTLQEATPAPTE